jgi:hypothetical protein
MPVRVAGGWSVRFRRRDDFDNQISQHAHTSLGFEPTLRLQFFRKRL